MIQRVSKLVLEWAHDNRSVLYIFVALALGFVLGRYRAFGAWGGRSPGKFGVMARRVRDRSLPAPPAAHSRYLPERY
jgi:hypothetical protein